MAVQVSQLSESGGQLHLLLVPAGCWTVDFGSEADCTKWVAGLHQAGATFVGADGSVEGGLAAAASADAVNKIDMQDLLAAKSLLRHRSHRMAAPAAARSVAPLPPALLGAGPQPSYHYSDPDGPAPAEHLVNARGRLRSVAAPLPVH
eukprot:SAG22_NODE_6249_length_879_cov_2.826923_2_plen_148_part_00